MVSISLNLKDAPVVKGFKDFPKASAEAVRRTLNIAAANTRKGAIQQVQKNLTLRNSFTIKQIRYDQVKPSVTHIPMMMSKVGASEKGKYLKEQHEGGEHYQRKPKSKVAIALRSARIAKSASKTVSKDMYIQKIRKNIVKGKGKHRGTRRSAFVAKMFMAEKLNKFIMKAGNIFRLRTITKRGDKISAKLEHLYTIKPRPKLRKKVQWLYPTAEKVKHQLGEIYKGQLRRQWKSKPEKL